MTQRKQFKILTLKFHPDKNPDDAQAKLKFQQLNEAYQILSNPKTKQVYDMTGDLSSTDIHDIRSFCDAYLYYREIYKRVEVEDIEQFEKTYRGSADEEEDLFDAYFE